MINLRLSIFLVIIFFFFIIPKKDAFAISFVRPIDPGLPAVSDSFCSDNFSFECWNSQAVGVTDCGTACPAGFGSTWSHYRYQKCEDNGDGTYTAVASRVSDVCSTGDKCMNPGADTTLNAGFCNCTTGGTYKYCCDASGNSEACIAAGVQDPFAPPEGECPGGYIVDGNRVRSSACTPICVDECAPGAQWCSSSTSRAACVLGGDGCYHVSDNACPGGATCNSATASCEFSSPTTNTLFVNSNVAGIPISGSQGGTGGGTNYTVTMSSDIDTVLTAPLSWGGQDFVGWSNCTSSGNQCFAKLSGGMSWTVTANYTGGASVPTPTTPPASTPTSTPPPSTCYVWFICSSPTQLIVLIGGSMFINNCGSGTVCGPTGAFGSPNIVCQNGLIQGCIPAPTATPTPPSYNISGTIKVDTLRNNCSSGATAYTSPRTLLATNLSTSSVSSATSNTSGNFAFSPLLGGNYNVALSIPAGYKIITIDGVATINNYKNVTLPPSQSINFCIVDAIPWYQVDKGNVRMNSVTNRVPNNPPATNAASDANYPGIYFSSSFPSTFSPGQVSAKGWRIDDEFSYSKNSSNKNGTVAYSYYKKRVSDTNQAILAVPGCPPNGPGANCSVTLTNLPTGIYEFDSEETGTLTITDYSQSSGAHVTLLVNGNVIIKSNISVPEGVGNLFILAAKGDVIVDKTVGEIPSSSTTNISGIYSAEGKIIIDGDSCPSGTPDKRLNIEGSIVANALKPFSSGGTGIFENKRSLCGDDADFPSVRIKTRPDFVIQLSDFYKVSISKTREVNP